MKSGFEYYPKERKIDPEKLPEKCCFKCDHWTDCSGKGFGICDLNDYSGEDDYDLFTYADSECNLGDSFEPREEDTDNATDDEVFKLKRDLDLPNILNPFSFLGVQQHENNSNGW